MKINFVVLFWPLTFLASVGYANTQVDSLLNLAEQELFQAHFNLSLELIDDAIEASKNSKKRTEYFKVLNQKGYVLTRMGRYDTAYSIHSSVLEDSKNLGFTDLEFETKYFLGVTRLFMSDFKIAEKLFLEVVDYFRIDDQDNNGMLGRSLTNLAFITFQKGDLTGAMEYVIESKGHLDSPNLGIHGASNHSLSGLIYFINDDLERAEESYHLALSIYRANNRRINLSGVYLGLANIYQKRNQRNTALTYLDSAKWAATGPYLGRELQAVHEQIYRFYYEAGDYQNAIKHLIRRDHIKDSISNTEQLLKVARLESNSDRRLEEMKVSMLQKQLLDQQQNIRVQKIWIFIIVIVSLYLLVFILVYRRLIRDKNVSQRELITKNNELEDKNQQIAKTQQMLIKSEKMALLGRISSGIAHELNTPISAIKGNLDLLNSTNQLEFERITEVAPYLNETLIQRVIEIASHAIKDNKHILEHTDLANRKQKIERFFAEVEIPNKPLVIDYFIELGVYEEIQTFYPIYSHEKNVKLLEIASHLATRVGAVKTALTATGKAMKMLDSFKTYSFKRGWKDLKPINLSTAFNLIMQLHKNDLRNVRVIKRVEGNVMVEGIQDELDQVWTNLITNAIHAMKYEGELFIEIVGLSNAVSVSMLDTGGGIHLPAGQDIFEPFFTTKPEGEGSGLGLDISKQIIKNHYGSISWRNMDRGVKFTVVLPRSQDKSLMIDE